MAYEKPAVKRIAGAVPLPVNDQIDKYAGLAGMSKTQFIGIIAQLGLNAWIRAYSPEKMLSPEDWKNITDAMVMKLEEGGNDAKNLLPSS